MEANIDIVVADSKLTVKGHRDTTEDEGTKAFLYKGLANRNFERSFLLADHVSVTTAIMENGLLTIDLKYEMPEERKPRRIEINQSVVKVKRSSETI
jgi:molecular chaperone IbpA